MGIALRHLPYVQITRCGYFRYRRPVAPRLKAAVGKSEILISLRTRDRYEAELRFLEVHLQVERWMRSLDPGSPAADFQFSLSAQPANSKTASLAGKLTGYASSGVHSLKITDALVLYLKDKETEFNQYVGRTRAVRLNEKDRAIRYLIAALGQDRELASLTKNDARIFRDYLTSKGLKAGSVQKNLKVCAAIIQVGLDEAGLNVPNPFHRLRVVADVSPRDSRLSLSKEEVRIVLRGKVNDELTLIRLLLALTGARLNEIAGLERGDITLSDPSHPIGFLDIRTNSIRRLKTPSSVRKVPLLPEAEAAIVAYLKGTGRNGSTDMPTFPRYGRPGGADAASAALMKALRARLEIHGWAFFRARFPPIATRIIAVETSMRRS